MAWGVKARAARFMWSKRGKSSPKRAAPVSSPAPAAVKTPPPSASGAESGSVAGAALRPWQAVPPEVECRQRGPWGGPCVKPVSEHEDPADYHADYEGRTWR